MRLNRIVDGPVRQPATYQPVRVVAAAGLALTRNRLAPRIDATHMRADRTAQTPGIARAIRIDVFEVVELLGRHSTVRAIAFRRQCQRNAIAPPPAYLGGKQFGIDLVPVRLKKSFKPDDISPDHLENGEAAVQTEFPRLRHEVILGIIPQYKQPGLAGLLVIERVPLGATADRGHADTVGVEIG